MKVEKELPEWKQTSDLQIKIKKICSAILPPRNGGKIFVIDRELFDSKAEEVEAILSSPHCEAIKVKNGLFQLVVDLGVNLHKREYSLATSHEFTTLVALYLAKEASFAESKRPDPSHANADADLFWSARQAVLLRAWAAHDFAYFEKRAKGDKPIEKTLEGEYPRRLQLAETVLSRRTSVFAIVIDTFNQETQAEEDDENEECDNVANISAALRTADCLGVHNIYIVLNKNLSSTRISKIKQTIRSKISRGTHIYLNVKIMSSFHECHALLESEKREIWLVHDHKEDDILDEPSMHSLINLGDLTGLPPRLAVVVALTQSVHPDWHAHAQQHVYLPFLDSNRLTFSIFSALIMQQMFIISPAARGHMTDEERAEIRREWYERLSRKNEGKKEEYLAYLDKPPPILDDLRAPPDSARTQQWASKKIQKRIEYTQKLKDDERERNSFTNNNASSNNCNS